MRLNVGNLTIRNLIISYILLYSIMPIVSRLTSSYLTTFFYMGLVVILVVLILALDRPENLNEYFTFLLPLFLYELLTFFSVSGNRIFWLYRVLLVMLPVILGYYFTQDLSRIKNSYSRIIIIAIIITMISTIIGCIQNPSAARILATVNSSDTQSYQYDMANIGGYNFIYIIVLLYPIAILAYKTRRIRLFPAIIIALLVLLTIVSSEYTTALLLFIISSFLFFTKRTLSAKGIIIISVFAILFLFVFSSYIVDFLHWLGEVVGSDDIARRLNALAGGAAGLEQSEDNRLELYRYSIENFLKSPFFGTLFNEWRSSGGHSFILDSLSYFGLLGGSLLFFVYKRVFMRFFYPFKDKPGYGYIVWTFIQVIILSIVNTGIWLDVLCLFVPLLLYWIYGTETKTEEVNNEDTVDSELASGSAG